MNKILLLVFISIFSNTFGTKTTFITDQDFKSVWLWQLSNTTITQEKGITLSPDNKKMYTSSELLWTGNYIDNTFYLGTGENSSVIKINPNDFSEETIFSSTNHAIVGDIVKEKSGFLIATSPESTLYHIDNTYKQLTNISLSNQYIWDIVPKNDTEFYLLTGDEATLYKYSNYQLETIATVTNEEHLIKGQIINDTLWILGEKALYKYDNDKLIAISSFQGTAAGFTYSNNTFYIIQSISKKANLAKDQPEEIFSKLYSVTLDGTQEELYCMQGAFFTSINMFNNQVIVGGDQFGLYVVYDIITKKHSYSSLGEGKIVDIIDYNDSLLLLTSYPSALWIVQTNIAQEGSFISEVYDTQHTATWGEFFAQISTPPNTSIEFYAQTGATADPIYWGKWYKIDINKKITAPSARYIRYKAIIKSDGKAHPYIESVRFPYIQKNIKPIITHTMIDQKEQTITLSWEAIDPNEDQLEYDVFLADDGLPKIKINKFPINSTNFIFPTQNYPSGYKRITIMASDKPSNTDASALTTIYQSTPILFDSEAPIISNITTKTNKQHITVSFDVQDKYSIIKEVSYTINGIDTIRVSPNDGILDSQQEQFTFSIPLSEPLFLQLKALDSANNQTATGMTILPQ